MLPALPLAAILVLEATVRHDPPVARLFLAVLATYVLIAGFLRWNAHSSAHDSWLSGEMMTVGQVSQYFEVRPETVRTWLRDGRLPGLDFGGRVGYLVGCHDVLRFDEAQRRDLLQVGRSTSPPRD